MYQFEHQGQAQANIQDMHSVRHIISKLHKYLRVGPTVPPAACPAGLGFCERQFQWQEVAERGASREGARTTNVTCNMTRGQAGRAGEKKRWEGGGGGHRHKQQTQTETAGQRVRLRDWRSRVHTHSSRCHQLIGVTDNVCSRFVHHPYNSHK